MPDKTDSGLIAGDPDPLALVLTTERYPLVIFLEDRVLVALRADGTLEYGQGYEPDEAARLFWQAIARRLPTCSRCGTLREDQ